MNYTVYFDRKRMLFKYLAIFVTAIILNVLYNELNASMNNTQVLAQREGVEENLSNTTLSVFTGNGAITHGNNKIVVFKNSSRAYKQNVCDQTTVVSIPRSSRVNSLAAITHGNNKIVVFKNSSRAYKQNICDQTTVVSIPRSSRVNSLAAIVQDLQSDIISLNIWDQTKVVSIPRNFGANSFASIKYENNETIPEGEFLPGFDPGYCYDTFTTGCKKSIAPESR